MLKWMHGPQAEFEHFAPGIKAGLLEQAQECIIAYESHLKAEGFVVVRAEPTEAMWGGLARDLVMWDRGMPNQYGSTLYKHLRACGRPIPDWLLAEIPDIDHTPPKGTVAVCIYRAMLSAATTGENDA
jgi:hypothetical protein